MFIELTNPVLDIKIGEKEFKLSPLGMKQWGQYCLWFKFKAYKEAKLIGVDEKHLREIFATCNVLNYQLDSPEIRTSLSDPTCLVYFLYLAATVNDPRINEHEFCSLINHNSLSDILDPLLGLMGLGGNETEEKNLESPRLAAAS